MIEDQGLAKQLLDTIEALLKTSAQLGRSMEKNDLVQVATALKDMSMMLSNLLQAKDVLKKEVSDLRFSQALLSIQRSLLLLTTSFYEKKESSKAIRKIEYELIPLIEEMRADFYFWGCVYPDREKMEHYYQKEMGQYYRNVYLERAEKTGTYPYEVSIVVLGYNKLDYTRMCIESLLRFIPEDLNYELILVNHGSDDGTKEYFESIEPHKQLDIAVNGGGVGAVYRICEGRYSLCISNDVLVTPNAIENMLSCMRSDESIAWVVPSTPNVSNCQPIRLKYDGVDQLWSVAKENNKMDPFRWEQRVRLCNPIDLRRNRAFYETQAATFPLAESVFSFPDDKISLLLRRNGYKLILAKDAYCYHFGSVTLKEELEAQGKDQVYSQGKKVFHDIFQINPWGKGHCYDPLLFMHLSCEKKASVRILGLNAGAGANSLKIKEALKENVRNTDCKLYNYTMEDVYLRDLESISDEVRVLSSWADFETCNQELDFDYILIEDHLENQADVQERVTIVQKHLKKDGYLIIRLATRQTAEWSEQEYSAVIVPACESTDYWAIIEN